MSLMPSRVALLVALALASPSLAASLITPQQAQATIVQNGFTPVGQPMLKGTMFGSLARLGNLSFVVTVDATTGQFLAARPSGTPLPPAATPPPAASPQAATAVAPLVNVTVRTGAQPTRTGPAVRAKSAMRRHYVPTYASSAGPKQMPVSFPTKPRPPTKRRAVNVNIKINALPKPSGFNAVLGPVFPDPLGGYFIVDPVLGPVVLDPGVFNAAVAVQQGLLPPSVLGPGYSLSSGYQLGFQDGLNVSNLNSLPQPLFVDPTQGAVFRDATTGGAVVYAPSTAPGEPPMPVPYVDPAQQKAFTDVINGIVDSTKTVVVPQSAEAAQQRLSTDPTIGTGQPLTDQQLQNVATAMGMPTPANGFTPQQKTDLQTIADHLVPDQVGQPQSQNAVANPMPATDSTQNGVTNAVASTTPLAQQHMTDAQLANFLDTLNVTKPSDLYTAVVAKVASDELGHDPTIGTGQPLTDQQFDNVAHAMGMTTPAGGFTDAQKADLQTIADHIIPDAPQTLQNTAANQAVQADPADVDTKALATAALQNPTSVDPNSITAVATAQPGMVDPVALNTVLQTNPADVAPNSLMQAAMANPNTVAPSTLDMVQEASPSFDPNGIATAPTDLQQQIDTAMANADVNAADTPQGGQVGAAQSDTAPDQGFSMNDFTGQMPATDQAAQPTPAADQGFNMSDFADQMPPDTNTADQAPTDANAAAADPGFTMNDFMDPNTGQPMDATAQQDPTPQPDMGQQQDFTQQPDPTPQPDMGQQQDFTQQQDPTPQFDMGGGGFDNGGGDNGGGDNGGGGGGSDNGGGGDTGGGSGDTGGGDF